MSMNRPDLELRQPPKPISFVHRIWKERKPPARRAQDGFCQPQERIVAKNVVLARAGVAKLTTLKLVRGWQEENVCSNYARIPQL